MSCGGLSWSFWQTTGLAEDAVTDKTIDRIVPVKGGEALRLTRALAREEGIFVGVSGGATLAGALTICETAEIGSTLLVMLPDTGERYLSTPLFEDIPEGMTEEELEIARSTPGYRFDALPPPPSADDDQDQAEQPAASVAALTMLSEAISDPEHPVTLYALEWCEFCWSVRKMFARYEIPYRSFDLDSVDYQKDNLGDSIRLALEARTGAKTIPQIFIGKEHIGGATELLDAAIDGSMQKLLKLNSVDYNESIKDDPYSFLPG